MSTVAAEQAYNDFPDALPVVGYALRNVAIKKTLVIPEDHHGIEIVVSMEFEDTATAKTPGWGSFSVSSIVRDTDQWTEHCSGFVKVEVSEFEPPAPIDLTMDARPVEPQAWYTRFADLGLQFGPSFQGYSDLRADPSKNLTSAQIALKTTKDLFPGGESYYPLHPASFDLVIRLGLIACNGGQSELASVQLPIHMSRMRLKKAHHDPKDEWATACGRGELRGLRGAYSQLQMFDKSGNVALEVENLRFTSLNNEQQQVDGSRASKAFSAPFTRLVWRPDIRSLNNEQIQTIIPSTEENISQIPLLQSIDRLAALVVSEILDNGREIDTPKELLDWIKAQASSGSKSMESARGLSVNERQKEIEELSQATSHVAESKVIQQIYNSLSSEENQRDSESVLAIESANPKSSSLFQGVYAQIAKLFDLLGHANPAQRILELKTDAAGPTPDIVKALAGPNGIKRYQSYTLASQSKDVLASLRELMSESRDIHYSTLDVTEPLAEVPQNDKYDVILFAHLRNSQDVQQSLANAKQLLKIGGKIVLLEQAHENTWATLVNLQLNSSSTLPRDDKYWDSALRQAGFSGIDLNIRDFPEGHSYAKVMVSTSEDQNDLSNGTANGNADLQAPTIFLLHGSSGPPKLLQGLATELERRGMRVTISPIDNAIESIGASARVVAFLDGENLLLDADQNRLSIFQHITSHSDSMVWVTSCGMVKGRNPDGAFVAGLLRGLGTENPTGQFMSIDVDAEHFEVGPRELKNLASCLADQEQALQHRPDDESNEVNRDFAWQDGCLWVSRVVPDDGIQGYAEAVKTPSADDEDMEHRLLSDQGPVRAAFATPGILTSLYFRPYTELLQPLPHDWIDVKVNAIGLNWKDLGLSSGRFDGHNLSSEYCGVVSAKGSSVQHLEIGDRVYGMGKGHFGNFTRVPAVTAQKLHQNDDAVVMATMPLVYMTAVYAFEHVVRLRKGQKVLIQSASGGLGLAAIELARAKGAEVFVTAGTPDKIRYLVEEMNVPPENVFSSRDASDVPRMIKATRNDGFDVILSTAQGDMLYESLKALAPLGHLIDVGRMDVTSSKSIALELFQKSAGFTSFDLGLVVDRDVAFGGELMKAVDEHYRAGRIGPIKAYTVSDVSQLDQVLLRFAKGTHIGKLVLNYQNPESKVRMQRTAVVPAQFDPEARYVLVGGLSGLGRAIVRWMSERGARDMLVLSRGGEKTVNAEGQALIKELASRDIRITVAACDVSNRKQTLQTVKAAAEDRAVRGVIHYAVDYQDISFDKMTLDKWNEGMAAKISGTKNLHEATLSLPLDFFVMTSSIGTIYAFPTQSTYTGANNFLDYFARYRRAQGLPASTLCMGFISDVGNLIHDPVTVNMIARAKALPITGNQFLRLLEPAILGSTAHAHAPATSQWLGRVDDPLSEANLFTALDPAALAALKRSEGSNAAGSGSLPRWYSDPRVSLIIQALDQAGRHYSDGNSASAHDAASTEGKSAAAQMRGQFDMAIKKIRDLGSDGAAVEERKAAREFVTDAIVTSVAGMLFMDKADVNPANTVADHGIDSLLAAEFRNWLHVAFRKHISMLDLMDARTSIDLLATSILDEALSK
jgi:NADPH:quinone reductase-like Zn-dependent oxidoreductase